MRLSGYLPLAYSSDLRVSFALKIFSAKFPESWVQRQRTLEQQPNTKMLVLSGASHSCK